MGVVAVVDDVTLVDVGIVVASGHVVRFNQSRETLVRLAANEVNAIRYDVPHLPKNLVDIFGRYATSIQLGDAFSPVHGFEVDGYDIGFISEVLGACFSFIGSGSFAEVFNLDQSWVLKVNCRDEYHSPVDGGFGWMKTCIKHQDNPYVPKIAAMEQRGHLYFSVVEHLHLGVGLSFADGSLGDLSEESHHPEFDIDGYVDNSEFTFAQFIKHSPVHAIEVARVYENHRMSVRGCDDISWCNVMHRDGFPVLTDPICDTHHGYAQLEQGSTFSWMLRS